MSFQMLTIPTSHIYWLRCVCAAPTASSFSSTACSQNLPETLFAWSFYICIHLWGHGRMPTDYLHESFNITEYQQESLIWFVWNFSWKTVGGLLLHSFTVIQWHSLTYTLLANDRSLCATPSIRMAANFFCDNPSVHIITYKAIGAFDTFVNHCQCHNNGTVTVYLWLEVWMGVIGAIRYMRMDHYHKKNIEWLVQIILFFICILINSEQVMRWTCACANLGYSSTLVLLSLKILLGWKVRDCKYLLHNEITEINSHSEENQQANILREQ